MGEKGFYTEQGVPAEEIERLKTVDFPNKVSESIFNNVDLNHNRVLDVGSGPNQDLGSFISEKGAQYIPIDLRHEMVKSIKDGFETSDAPFYGVVADVKQLPFEDDSIEYAHQRFVLMHLSPDDQQKAVQELVRVASKSVYLLEYNWETLTSSTDPDKTDRFRDLSFAIMKYANIDGYMGKNLLHLAQTFNPNSIERRYKREEGDYTKELILNCRTGSGMARTRLKNDKLADDMEALAQELEREPIRYVPPEIVAVTIEKQII